MSDKQGKVVTDVEAKEQPEFNDIAWTALLGVRAGDTIATARSLELRWVLSPIAMLPDGGGHKANMEDPAVDFAAWFERHKQGIVNMWSESYAQRMNIRRMTAGPGKPPEMALVDPTGRRLSTDVTQ